MVALYVKVIGEGKMTLKQVPPRWHDVVAAELKKKGEDYENEIRR